MISTSKRFQNLLGSLLTVLVLALAAQAQEASRPQQQLVPQVRIKNFGQMDERFFRGAQPKEDEYEALKALGVQTVIDLQAEPKDYERRIVESLGMRYVNIPMVEKKYPTDEAVETFLKLVEDPSTGKFFVHCAGGRHRTGVMGAVYRFTRYGWDYEQAYREMKDYDFYTRWGHGDFKRFVQDYWQKFQTQKAAQQQQPAPSVTATSTAGGGN